MTAAYTEQVTDAQKPTDATNRHILYRVQGGGKHNK